MPRASPHDDGHPCARAASRRIGRTPPRRRGRSNEQLPASPRRTIAAALRRIRRSGPAGCTRCACDADRPSLRGATPRRSRARRFHPRRGEPRSASREHRGRDELPGVAVAARPARAREEASEGTETVTRCVIATLRAAPMRDHSPPTRRRPRAHAPTAAEVPERGHVPHRRCPRASADAACDARPAGVGAAATRGTPTAAAATRAAEVTDRA